MTTNKLLRLSLPIAAGAACMIVLLSLMTTASQWLNTSPHVGDIVAFTPTPTLSPSTAARLRVQKTDRQACILDLATLHSLGGSLLIESHFARQFVVHWAGRRTSNDTADCGAAADLTLDQAQIGTLDAAARDYIPGLRPVWLPGQDGV